VGALQETVEQSLSQTDRETNNRLLKISLFYAINNYRIFTSQLSNVQQQRLIVEQLRREAAIKRINISQAIEDIKVRSISFLKEFLILFLKNLLEIHHRS